MEQADCGFCGSTKPQNDLVRGRKSFICSRCVASALSASITEPRRPKVELPEADAICSFCGKKAPESSLQRSKKSTDVICTACLGRGYWFLAENGPLRDRQQTWRFLDERSPSGMVHAHFEGTDADSIVTSSRTFPEYMRVDLNRTLAALLPPSGARSIGLHQHYGHETLQYATVLSRDARVSIAPVQYDELDIGEEDAARCVRNALWLAERDGVPHVVLLSQAQSFGRSNGWHVEIAVPAGERGDAVVRFYFKSLEDALEQSVSYRGKVLSLEKQPRMEGTSATISVHRLSSVGRDDVILPAKTLDLLERNVFKFSAYREALREMGLPAKKGLLFYGPPGTGKTHTIRYLAGALKGHTTLLMTAEQVAQIDRYMTLARLLSPSIVVIEDADLIARQREDMDSPGQEALLNKLLNEMDGLRENTEILFILTTNRPEALELALTARPGRIDQAIEFPLPDDDGRRKLARLYGRGITVPAETLEHIVTRTARVSAAFIKELMRRSAQFALERVGAKADLSTSDVDAALDELLFAGGRLNAALLGALGAREPDPS